MKSVLISINSKWTSMILTGEKTIEIRKNKPKIDGPFKCYIYCTINGDSLYLVNGKPMLNKVVLPLNQHSTVWGLNGYVVAEFICKEITPIKVFYNGLIQNWMAHGLDRSCVPYDDVSEYIGFGKTGYGWRIYNLKIYDEPKELNQFWKFSNDGERPCEKGKDCEYEYYDFSEDCRACGIDFGGDDCPHMRMSRPPQSWCYVEGKVEK